MLKHSASLNYIHIQSIVVPFCLNDDWTQMQGILDNLAQEWALDAEQVPFKYLIRATHALTPLVHFNVAPPAL